MIERRAIVYYSWIGSTKVVSDYLSKQTGIPAVPIVEIKERPVGNIMRAAMGAFFCVRSALKPMDYRMEGVKTLMLASPVWAGKTPPAINTFLKKASFQDKDVYLVLTQGDDKPNLDLIARIATRIEKKGGTVKGRIHFQTHWDPQTNQPVAEEAIRPKADAWLAQIGVLVRE